MSKSLKTNKIGSVSKTDGITGKKEVCSDCFGMLGTKSRMVIYQYLKDKKAATVGEIVDVVKLTQPTISYHLKEMRASGLLDSMKKGKEVFYSLSCHCNHLDKECVLAGVKF